jgi:hypothetical protein
MPEKTSSCPAPAEGVKVCTVCRKSPDTCGHADGLPPDYLRKALVWCCDWQPKEYQVPYQIPD